MSQAKKNSDYLKRRILWKAFNRSRARYVRQVERLWQRSLRKFLTDDDDNVNILRQAMQKTYIEVGGAFGRRELSKLEGKKAFGDINDVIGATMNDYVNEQMIGVINSIKDTSQKKYAAILYNTDITDAERLALIDELILSRSRIIAQNEVLGASNIGQQAAIDLFQENNPNVAVFKTWLATIDDRVRDAHEAADGQTIRNNDLFDVGGEGLRYPRDPSGSPGNTINCRCVVDTFKQEI